MKKTLSLLWRWSWVITLPVACAFIYWAWVTADRYYNFGVRYDPRPVKYELHQVGENVYRVALGQAVESLSGSAIENDPRDETLNIVNLFVPESNLAQLNSGLPHTGFEYVQGGIWNEGKLQKMKFKYRGDFIYHWGEEKKSLRVKTSKKKMYNGLRTFNLIGTKQLETHFGNVLAKEFGLIAPITELVEVTLNGRLLGMHAYVEQLEELTLRTNGFMPGDIYAGEIVAKDAYRGANGTLFDYPQLWEKVAINNHFDEASLKPLEKLIALINEPNSTENQKQLSALLNLEAWGKFSALESLTHSFHYDDHHNWRLYYDPMSSQFYPVIWDPLAWHHYWKTNIQLDVIPSRFHHALFKNAGFLKSRARAISDFYTNGQDERFIQRIEDQMPSLTRAIERDPLLTESAEDTLATIDEFVALAKKVLTTVKKGFMESNKSLVYSINDASSSSLSLDYLVSGRMPIARVHLRFSKTLAGSVQGSLTHLLDGQPLNADISSKISVNANSVVLDQTLLANHVPVTGKGAKLRSTKIVMEDGYYQLHLHGIDPANKLLDVRVEFFDGSEMMASKQDAIEPSSFSGLYGVVEEAPVVQPLIWDGIVNIDGIQEIDTPLIIMPGTIIRMAPDASLILRGRVLAEGTIDKPIKFIPADEAAEPWGTVAVVGQFADYSKLNYVEFAGGSGLKRDLFEYTAMLSIHSVSGMSIENSHFKDSKITDDMVHTVYAKDVRFTNSVFDNALLDALDIDISTAVIDGCRFTGSGNDSIDLMASSAVVTNTLIENSGDKAASVGEGSQLLAINNIFRNNLIAVQAKDGSTAALYNVDLIGNDHALDAYNKNWRYNAGGNIYTYKSILEGNNKLLSADKKSGIRVVDSFIDVEFTPPNKKINLAESVDSANKIEAVDKRLERHEKEEEAMSVFDTSYWEMIAPKRRGAVSIVTN